MIPFSTQLEMIEDQAINEQDDNKILHDERDIENMISDMFSLDQSELTEKLDQVEFCKKLSLFKKWPGVTKEQRRG